MQPWKSLGSFLSNFTANLPGLVPAPGTPTGKFLKDDGTWAAAAGGPPDVSATARLLGRISGGAGPVEELTGTQATTLIDPVTNALKGLAPASGGGTANFLRADATWANPLVLPEATLAQVKDIANAINTTGKYRGRLVLETTTGRTLRASGPLAADPWYTPSGGSSLASSINLNLFEARHPTAYKDQLPDIAAAGVLGLADTGPLIAATAIATGTVLAAQFANWLMVLPPDYLAGGPISLKARSRVTTVRAVSCTLTASVKRIETSVGSELVTAGSPVSMNQASFTTRTFTIDPTTLAPGQNGQLLISVSIAGDDTGGSSGGTPQLSGLWLDYQSISSAITPA